MIASGETGNTTSHLTEAVDARYQTLIKDVGEDRRPIGGAIQPRRDRADRVDRARLADRLRLRAGARLSLHGASVRRGAAGQRARRARGGPDAPCSGRTACRCRFQPRGASIGRARRRCTPRHTSRPSSMRHAPAGSSSTNTQRVLGVHEDEPSRVETDHGRVRAHHVFVAANVPVNNRVLLHTKIAAYRSYAIAADAPPAFPDGTVLGHGRSLSLHAQAVGERTDLSHRRRRGSPHGHEDRHRYVLRAPARGTRGSASRSTAGATTGRGRSSSRWTGCRTSAATPRSSTCSWRRGIRATA